MSKRYLNFGLLLAFICFETNILLVKLNEFWDRENASPDVVIAEMIRTTYRPFPVDSIVGTSGLLGPKTAVDVLPETAQATKVGDGIEIVTGRGFLGKRWVDTKAESLTVTPAFRYFYVGLFAVLLAAASVGLLRFAKSNGLAPIWSYYAGALTVGALWFYVS